MMGMAAKLTKPRVKETSSCVEHMLCIGDESITAIGGKTA
jgi:hypothetical protein